MSALDRYAEKIIAALEPVDAKGKAISRATLGQRTGLTYGQVGLGLHHIRNEQMLINGKPLRSFQVGYDHFYSGANNHDEAKPYVRRTGRYATTLVTSLYQLIETVADCYGDTPEWRRLQIDVDRVKLDLELMSQNPPF